MSFSTSFQDSPIKTLKSCIWVCKSLFQAIHSPPFATIHFKKASQSATHLTSLLIRDRDKPCELGLLELEHNCFTNSSNTFHEVDDNDGLTAWNTTTLDQLNSGYECVGSCHGLLCLVVSKYNFARDAIEDGLYLCNPVFGEYTTMPPPTQSTMHRIGYGFGFDSATNEYKVIRLAYHWIDFGYIRKPSFQLVGEVCLLQSIGNVPYLIDTKQSEAFVTGALHWISDSYVTEVSPRLIVSFDVGTEEFKVVPHPPGYCHGKPENYLLDLGELGGQICLLDDDFCDDYLVVWMMKEYGVKESWVKEYVVERPRVVSKRPNGSDTIHFIPLTLLNDKEILFLGDCENLLIYDPFTGS